MENLLKHWNHAVLFNLDNLSVCLQTILDRRLEAFVLDNNNKQHFAILGSEVDTIPVTDTFS